VAVLDQTHRAIRVISILRQATKNMVKPASFTIVQEYGRNPYLVLISCLLSLRTKDSVSLPASQELFKFARTPHEMLKIPVPFLEKIIYKTGFYRRKAQVLRHVSQALIERFHGKVPNTKEELLSLPGVGDKTANLVLGEGFGIPAICVDTHVHRISNRLGLVKSRTPKETEEQLKKVLPEDYWIEYNHLMVMWGQNICVPVSPFCTTCAVADLCPRIGVKRSR
jgi:endonuclease-3